MSPCARSVWTVAVGIAMACAPEPSNPQTLSSAALGTAPLHLDTPDGRVTLEAEAWRSFQPITQSRSGDPLIVMARLSTAAGALSSAIQIDTVFLLRGSEQWAGRAVEETPRAAGSTQMEVLVRNGPNWAPGDSIDLVARVTLAGGKSALVRAPRVEIARVD